MHTPTGSISIHPLKCDYILAELHLSQALDLSLYRPQQVHSALLLPRELLVVEVLVGDGEGFDCFEGMLRLNIAVLDEDLEVGAPSLFRRSRRGVFVGLIQRVGVLMWSRLGIGSAFSVQCNLCLCPLAELLHVFQALKPTTFTASDNTNPAKLPDSPQVPLKTRISHHYLIPTLDRCKIHSLTQSKCSGLLIQVHFP
jgi:hypothetical protein